jgi:hypothetical protein
LMPRGVPRNAAKGSEGSYVLRVMEGRVRDHRIVAWAPGGDGLVEIRRAPKSGTAATATTIFGSDANPATTARDGRCEPDGISRILADARLR